MPLYINSNINSLKGMNSLRKNSSRLSKTLEHISSGIRVNKAADDAGRLGAITLAESQVRGLQKSIQNLNDGLSLAQTLEGGLGQMELILQRMRELAVQASTDTYNAADRQTLNAEVQQLLNQIDKISEQTHFNNIKLLNGSADSVGIFVDDGLRTESFDLKLHDVRDSSVGRKAQYDSQRRGVHVSDLATGDVKINGFEVRATDDTDDNVSFSFGSGSAIAKANAINAISQLTGVTARAGATRVIANRQIGAFTLTTTQNFAINGVKIGGFAIEEFDADGVLRQAINAHAEQTGVVASLTSNGQLQLIAQDGRNIQIAYSHKNVLEAVGLADTTLDPNNLAGDVILGAPDRDLKGTINNINTTGGFIAGLTEVGGRFDGSEDSKDNYVDFVGHVVKAGGVGVAEIVWERDDGSDDGSAENFDFIEGSVNGVPVTTGVNGSFFTSGGEIIAGGSYNEGLNRDYKLTVTQTGSTDGPDLAKRAVVRVSTTQDGVITNALTLDATAGPQKIATSTTGEDVFIDIGPSIRSSTLSEGGTQEYDGTLGNGVSVTGTYTGDISKDFTVKVIDTGYTQGANQAKVEVTEKNLVTNVTTTLGSYVVSAATAITIGDGLKITFDAETPSFGVISAATIGTYAGAVTVNSAASDFIGERGDGTYGIRITQKGPTGLAKYVTTFKPDGGNSSDITAAQTLNSGVNNLADGLSFNAVASVATIGATSISTQAGDYGSYDGVTIGGDYDGQLSDIDVHVRVKSEGRVLAKNETEQADGAILEYSVDGGANFQGNIVAVAGTILNLSNGITLEIDDASAVSELKDTDGNVVGASHTFNSGSVQGYDGQIKFDLTQTALTISTDARISFKTNAATIGTGVDGSGDITVTVGGNDFVLSNVKSGVANSVIPGLKVTFTNDAATVVDTTPAGNDDGANITLGAGAVYNGTLGNGTLSVSYTGDTNQNAQADNDDRVGVSLTGTYNGSVDDETYTVTFDGTSSTIQSTGTGANGVNDNAAITINGSYNGTSKDKSLTISYVGGSTETVANQLDGAAGSAFDVKLNGDYNRTQDDLSFIVTFEADTDARVTGHHRPAGTLSDAVVAVSANTFDWDAGSHALELKFVADDTAQLSVDGTAVGPLLTGTTLATIDLGSVDFIGAFNNVDPGVDITVAVDAVKDETGEVFTLEFNANQSVSLNKIGGPETVTGVTLTDAVTTLNLGDAKFNAIFGGVDPGITLDVKQASVKDTDSFRVDLSAIREVNISDGTNSVNNFDISSGSINLGSATFSGIFTGGDPGVTLSIADTFAGVDDVYTLDLNTKTTVSIKDSTDAVIAANADVSGGTISIAGTGVTVNFTDANAGVDDVVTVALGMDKTVNVSFDGTQRGGAHSVAGNSLDLGAVFGAAHDPGFDLTVANPVKGRNDTFTFELTRDRGISGAAVTLLDINQRTLAAGDLFTSDVDAGTLEVGSAYTLDVDAPALKKDKTYTIEQRVGTLEVNDEIVVKATHAFAQGPSILQTSTTLSNGLTLEIDPAATFNIGDEVRFQALQYQGDPGSLGPYDDPAFPTTFVVEVVQSGAVDGGAQVRYTRQDNLDTGVVAASTVATLLQNNVHVSFTAGTLYEGDQFFIETVSDLVQDFGGELILESNKGIEIELSSVTIDNELGRLLYVGDPALAQAAGTFDSLTSAFLGVNAEQSIAELDITTKLGAQNALRVVDLAIDEISAFRSETGAVQNRIENQVNSLSEALYQTENYVSRIRDADLAIETAQLAAEQIIQQAGVQILAQMNLSPQVALQLVQSL